MSKERMGEIALEILVNRAIKNGFTNPRSMKRELGNLAKEIHVPLEDLVELSKHMLNRVIGAMYGATRVSLMIETPD